MLLRFGISNFDSRTPVGRRTARRRRFTGRPGRSPPPRRSPAPRGADRAAPALNGAPPRSARGRASPAPPASLLRRRVALQVVDDVLREVVDVRRAEAGGEVPPGSRRVEAV